MSSGTDVQAYEVARGSESSPPKTVVSFKHTARSIPVSAGGIGSITKAKVGLGSPSPNEFLANTVTSPLTAVLEIFTITSLVPAPLTISTPEGKLHSYDVASDT